MVGRLSPHSRRNSARFARAALVLSGVVLLAGWANGWWRSAPPVYDGLPTPVEPYRYLRPPPGFNTTAPPSSATLAVVATRPRAAQPSELNTSENPPQATLIISSAAFAVPPGTRVQVSVRAVVPQAAPTQGRFDGNVYRFVGAVGHKLVGLAPGATATVALRRTGERGKPTLRWFDGTDWVPLPTTEGGDYVSAKVSRLGDFAIVLVPHAAAGLGTPASSGIALGAALVAIGVLLVVVRALRSRHGADPVPS